MTGGRTQTADGSNHRLSRVLEATPGFEPGIKALQASALPLGDVAVWGASCAPLSKKVDRLGGIPARRADLRSVDGADDGIRTRDPNLGKVVLYQLSHVRALCQSSGTIRGVQGSISRGFRGCPRRGLPIGGRFATLSFAASQEAHRWAISSGGEHFLDTEGVRGSNPLSPTSNIRGPDSDVGASLFSAAGAGSRAVDRAPMSVTIRRAIECAVRPRLAERWRRPPGPPPHRGRSTASPRPFDCRCPW